MMILLTRKSCLIEQTFSMVYLDSNQFFRLLEYPRDRHRHYQGHRHQTDLRSYTTAQPGHGGNTICNLWTHTLTGWPRLLEYSPL